MTRKKTNRQDGSVTVLTAGILAVLGTVTFAVVKLGVAANERARAQAIADVASLAGASSDLDMAKRLVASNGGVVLLATESGESIDVSISVGDARAEARAERRYLPWNPIDYGPGAIEDLETTTIATIATVPTTTRALIFPTIPSPTTTRALVFPTIPTVTTKKPAVTIAPRVAPVPGTSPRSR